uniref:WD_REPEATS_REGION domain-containing protein n=1 Tax=Steinernema glaseri TaxID=37863 RepID=A0A1I8A4S4_9BILA
MDTKLNMISSAVWIKRGVAKSNHKVEKCEVENPVAPSIGPRGSLSNLAAPTNNQEEKYKMDCYDNEEVTDRDGLRGIACFANNTDDPYMTNVAHSNDESDAKDREMKETDTLLAALKTEDVKELSLAYNTLTIVG